MTNDAKLGMLAGVVGVVFAAVFFAKPPEQPGAAEPQPKHSAAAPSASKSPPEASSASATHPESRPAALPSTPVVRVRKELEAQPASRPTNTDEEP